MKHTWIRITVTVMLLTVAFPLYSQTVNDARTAFEQGKYQTAVSYYNTLIEDYKDNNRSTRSLEQEKEKAAACQALLSDADKLRIGKRYTKAIEAYRQLLAQNPSDPNAKKRIRECERLRTEQDVNKAIEAEWNRCRSIADYRLFREKYPNSRYEQQALQRIAELEQREDKERWMTATVHNSIDSYESYISNNTPSAKHIGEAKQKLYALYISEASHCYDRKDYPTAKKYYEKANDLFKLAEISEEKYRKCCEEIDFAKLEHSNYRFMVDMEAFVKKYPTSYHASIVRGWMVESEMSRGNFDAARAIVNKNAVAFSETNTPNKKWWNKYIKEREKGYKKNHKASVSGTNRSNGNLASNKGGSRYPFQLSVPVVIDYSKRIWSMGGGIGIGGYGSPFHIDILALYNVDSTNPKQPSLLIKAEPVYNFKRYNSSDAISDFHINAGPIVGYSSLLGLNAGAKIGIGLHYSDLAITATWAQNFGWYYGVSFRFHLFHFTIH